MLFKGSSGVPCCPVSITESLQDAAAHQLAGLKIYPHIDEEDVVYAKVEVWRETFADRSFNNKEVVLQCLNGLRPTSAYHLLHLMHHINGAAFTLFKDSTLDDANVGRLNEWLAKTRGWTGMFKPKTQLEHALSSSLRSAYTAIGLRSSRFKIYTRTFSIMSYNAPY